MSIVIPEGLARLAEVARRLRLSVQTLRRWIKRGRIRGYRMPSGGWRVAWPDVEAALERTGGPDGESAAGPVTETARRAARQATEEIARRRRRERQEKRGR